MPIEPSAALQVQQRSAAKSLKFEQFPTADVCGGARLREEAPKERLRRRLTTVGKTESRTKISHVLLTLDFRF